VNGDDAAAASLTGEGDALGASSSREGEAHTATEPFAGYPPALRALMAEVGPVWAHDMRRHRDRVWAAFEPGLRTAPQDGVTCERDLRYGDHPRQVLDVYRPSTDGDGSSPDAHGGRRLRPVIVFVHGGAFVRGERNISEVAYANVLTWFARQGLVGVNMEYRLAPEAPWPAGADDIAGVVRWLKAHAAEHGGDAGSIVLVGHSSGGTHVATYAFDADAGYLGNGVRGVVLLSARLRADRLPVNPNAPGVEAYFGRDDALLDRRSPVSHAHRSTIPTLIAVAEFENPLLDVYAAEMAQRLGAARGHLPRFLQLRGHNHISVVAHFNTGEELLGREILAFCEALG
jgi:acetyl esterase/lipase